MDAINNRRSVRKYIDKPVEKEKIEKLLRAAMQAPSAANQHPWEFIVVQDQDTLNMMSHISPYANMLSKAPLAFVLLADEEKMSWPEMWQQDLSAAAENLLLEAVELGLGAVWLGVYPLGERVQLLREMFRLKENIIPFCVIPIGYPAGQGNNFIDRYDPSLVHYETYEGERETSAMKGVLQGKEIYNGNSER